MMVKFYFIDLQLAVVINSLPVSI